MISGESTAYGAAIRDRFMPRSRREQELSIPATASQATSTPNVVGGEFRLQAPQLMVATSSIDSPPKRMNKLLRLDRKIQTARGADTVPTKPKSNPAVNDTAITTEDAAVDINVLANDLMPAGLRACW